MYKKIPFIGKKLHNLWLNHFTFVSSKMLGKIVVLQDTLFKTGGSPLFPLF
jgi:hypothetical protein